MIAWKLDVPNLDAPERAERLISLLKSAAGVVQVDVNLEKRRIRVLAENGSQSFEDLRKLAAGHGYELREIVGDPPPRPQTSSLPSQMKVAIDGMHCHSCEITIERRFKKLPGVKTVNVDAAKGMAHLACDGSAPTIEELNAVIHKDGYVARALARGEKPRASKDFTDGKRPTFWQLVGLFTLVFVLGSIVARLGLLKAGIAISPTTGFWTVFVVGLVAASSSCIAVSGGLLLSSAAKFNERYGTAAPMARMRPVFMFVAGRIASYGLLGGVIGAVGKALSPSPLVTGMITVLAALYMLTMGLDMLHLAPAWLKGLMPRMPKSLSHRIMDAEGHEHPMAPFMLGAATFFIPCGFTQSLQLYALTTGSFWQSASLLFAFALGTAPALLALGWASSSLKGAAGRFFFRFSGALVIVLGLWNIQNGLTTAGYPLRLPSLTAATAATAANAAEDPNVKFDGETQVIRMKLGFDPYYLPSDEYTVKAGVPVRLEVEGPGTGCRSQLQIPKLGVRLPLTKSLNVAEFTPKKPGNYIFSCAMGMFPGRLTVVAS